MRTRCLLALLALAATSCQTEADIRPANYDELALATGHWEWDAWLSGTSGAWGAATPAKLGFTQQLTFGAGGQLTVRRNGQVLRQTPYQFSVGTFNRCGQQFTGVPLLTYTGEKDLPTDEAKTYELTTKGGQQVLTLIGRETCVDYGATEVYHWVAAE